MTTLANRPSPAGSGSVRTQPHPAPGEGAEAIVMPHSLRDHVVDETDENFTQLSDRYHYRQHSIGRAGAGTFEFCGLSDGFFILFGDFELAMPHSFYLSCPDSMQIHVASNGEGEYLFPHGDKLTMEATNTSIFIQPAGEPPAKATFEGCNRYMAVSIHREVLRTLHAGDEGELPEILKGFLDGTLQQTLARPLPLKATLLRCLDDVHACSLERRRRRIFLEAKAMEIVCHAIDALEHVEGFGSPDATMLTTRGVMKAQRLLAENFVTPPSLEDLAREVGLSRSGLCAGFRQILGRSVFDYTQDLRMEQALAMLNRRDASISQIAHAVGYNRPSSFSVAVQRHFGATPTELRRRAQATN